MDAHRWCELERSSQATSVKTTSNITGNEIELPSFREVFFICKCKFYYVKFRKMPMKKKKYLYSLAVLYVLLLCFGGWL
jgi:hypothetical protein